MDVTQAKRRVVNATAARVVSTMRQEAVKTDVLYGYCPGHRGPVGILSYSIDENEGYWMQTHIQMLDYKRESLALVTQTSGKEGEAKVTVREEVKPWEPPET